MVIPNLQLTNDFRLGDPSRSDGLRILHEFVPHASRYSAARNFDLPGHPGVSCLSPYLRHRLITEAEVIKAVLEQHSFRASSKFIEEVCWRTYWKGWLEMRPGLWSAYHNSLNRLTKEAPAAANGRGFEQVCQGESGIGCFDHWMRELLETGYLHNHARMWFASIWIFTLRLPWELGADLFLRHLVDGDPASNTLSWRWVAGLHTRGKPYVARASNIEKFTEGRFAPYGELEESPEPLAEETHWRIVELKESTAHREARFPTLSTSPAGLLIIEDDLYPEASELGDCPFSSVASFFAQDVADEMRLSPRVCSFRKQAMADAARRAGDHWSDDPSALRGVEELFIYSDEPAEKNVSRPTPLRVYSGSLDNWVRGVCLWAQRERLKAVRVLCPTVGPFQKRLYKLRSELGRLGVSLQEHRRRWDDVHWPHAKSGYFSYRRGLEKRLGDLGIL
ncbi:MAG: hypothetical protein JJT96_02910 [Opitutales bacterium]|nr:hypothetical protein [Opitutales bacterium]